MSAPYISKELADREFAALGEKQVRDIVAMRRYDPHKLALAEMWLSEQERARANAAADRDHKLALQSLAVDKSAKNAAWVANIISVVALVVAIVALFFSLQ